jgi:hypothetical protein
MAEIDSGEVERVAEAAPPQAQEHDEIGGELILHEARDEVARLVTHPVTEIKRLEHVADEGESAATPLIVMVGLTLGLALVLAILLAVILIVYYRT